jgi:rubrerythrin
MKLPMNATPVYTLTIPSTGKDIKYRPFLVRDEKALLIAQQSENSVVMLDTLKDVIRSCAKSEVDVDSLASFDVEFIFAQLRAVSVGEIVDLVFRCDTCEVPEAITKVAVDLRQIKVETPEHHTNKFKLFGDVGIVMKYPTVDTLKKIEMMDINNTEQVFEVTVDCIDYIYNADEVFPAHEQTKDELFEFLNNLTPDQFEDIQVFFKTLPQVRAYVKYTCPVCQKEHNKYMEGLQSFF